LRQVKGKKVAKQPVIRPTLVLVGAQKGGVGKTTTARLLMHWLAENKRQHAAFDTEHPVGSLARFYPSVTEIVDLSRVADQARVFDTLAAARDGTVLVLDLKAGMFYDILSLMEDLHLFRDARDGAFNLVFLHVIGSTLESTKEIADTFDRFKGASHIAVKNVASGANMDRWDASRAREAFLSQGGVEIEVPPLDPLAYQAVDDASTSFRDFVDNKRADDTPASHSYTLRAYVRRWLLLSTLQLDKLGL
jgi:CobQ/CobB/MinD/ParA nucleotide binding domain